jgi:hypothetical protein
MARFALTILLAACAVSGAHAGSVDPIQKVLQMLGDLQSKVVAEGTAAQKVYEEFSEFCETRARELEYEIKTSKGQVSKLEATIENEAATIQNLNSKIEEVAASISGDEADLKAATTIRNQENTAFKAEEKELIDVTGTLERAIGILEKELAKSGSASMMQLKGANSITQALTIMVEASSLSSADSSQLSAFLQNAQQSDDSEEELGAPAAKVYAGKSGGIVATMEDLHEKAETQLAKARGAEKKSANAFAMLAQSLNDEIKYANKELDEAKKSLEASTEGKATAEGDLSATTTDLNEDTKALSTLHSDCMTGAEDFQAETKSRGEELTALKTATKIISDMTAGATSQSYDFLQTSLTSGADLAKFEALRFVRDLAKKQKSAALAQLASRMAVVIRAGGRSGEDPFGKVKDLIKNMIEKLLKDAEADATEKAFCDKEMAETETKKADKEAAVEKLSSQIDSMVAKSAQLKEQVGELQKELAATAKAQAEMDSIRADEKAAYDKNSAEMEQGVKGVQMALKVLRDYYAKDSAHGSSGGAGGSIIGLLEVSEADFSKGLAEMNAAESTAASEYKTTTQENKITKATKDQSVKYKTKEFKGLDKATAESTADRATVQDELDAVNEYYGGLKERCIAKPESYADRVQRREAEIAGLKEALSILKGQAVLLQRSTLRGTQKHM